jgi:hypothetical protein
MTTQDPAMVAIGLMGVSRSRNGTGENSRWAVRDARDGAMCWFSIEGASAPNY